MDSSPLTPFKDIHYSNSFINELPAGCKAFGAGASQHRKIQWIKSWSTCNSHFTFILILAGSKTAEIEGISAAGHTPDSRRYTAVADAELILHGPAVYREWALPPLPAGISPALISYVAKEFLRSDPLILTAGLNQLPSFPHIPVDSPLNGPASCLSTGKAMSLKRVEALWNKGYSMGKKLRQPLLIAECIPGGTTTAQAILTGLGLSIADLISSSSRTRPLAIKKKTVEIGLQKSGLKENPLPKQLLAAVGDPFQVIATGLLIGARQAGQPVLLGGGSQMLAVIALALRTIKPTNRSVFVNEIVLGTTSWLAEEKSSSQKSCNSLMLLMDKVGKHFGVELLGIASGLRFNSSRCQALRDYELGFIKEGVGAGALSLLAQLNGASCNELIKGCETGVDLLK